MGDSETQTSFSSSAINQIRTPYKSRCVICMASEKTAQCAHIIDKAEAGKIQVRNSVRVGVLAEGYRRNAVSNGMLLCPTCHSRFAQNSVVLSLPIPLLKYLKAYVQGTPKTEQVPLHKVLSLLVDAKNGALVPLRNPESVFAYVGLYTMVTLRPDDVPETTISTSYFPKLCILRGHRFVKAPASTSATSAKAVRIFDADAIDKSTPRCAGYVPLSPQDPEFKEVRYWRIPAPADVITAAFFERLQLAESDCEDLRLGRLIHAALEMQAVDDNPPGGSKQSGGGRDGTTSRKRKDPDDNRGQSNCKKRRKDTGPNIKHANSFLASQRILRSNKPMRLMGLHVSDADSESGASVTAAHPHNKDDPKRWQFSPSFSTNKNVFIARAVSLVHP